MSGEIRLIVIKEEDKLQNSHGIFLLPTVDVLVWKTKDTVRSTALIKDLCNYVFINGIHKHCLMLIKQYETVTRYFNKAVGFFIIH